MGSHEPRFHNLSGFVGQDDDEAGLQLYVYLYGHGQSHEFG